MLSDVQNVLSVDEESVISWCWYERNHGFGHQAEGAGLGFKKGPDEVSGHTACVRVLQMVYSPPPPPPPGVPYPARGAEAA
jgi:hypothetical protein